MLSLSKHEDIALCQHFGICGGCLYQDMPPADYAAAKRALVQSALMKAGVTAEVLPPVIVPPKTRRRAVFKIKKSDGIIAIGFHAAKSHTIVDMRQCLVLTPGLFDLAQVLRERLAPLLADDEAAELHATETATGFDAHLKWRGGLTPALTAGLMRAFSGLDVARLTMGRDVVFETAQPTIALDGVPVALPPNPFLQASPDGEAALQQRVLKIAAKAKTVADLFSGAGTFALPLARKARIHAVEQNKSALAALTAAARTPGLKPVTVEARDLFKLPLTALELAAYEAVVLDPPRAGAEAQARTLAKSRVPVIAYVSCDAGSFARDAAILIQGGYAIGPVTPVDQFLWSSHIELVAGFAKGGR